MEHASDIARNKLLRAEDDEAFERNWTSLLAQVGDLREANRDDESHFLADAILACKKGIENHEKYINLAKEVELTHHLDPIIDMLRGSPALERFALEVPCELHAKLADEIHRALSLSLRAQLITHEVNIEYRLNIINTTLADPTIRGVLMKKRDAADIATDEAPSKQARQDQ